MNAKYFIFGLIAVCGLLFSACTKTDQSMQPVDQEDAASAYTEPQADYSQGSSLNKPFDYKAEEDKSKRTPKKDNTVVTPDQIH